MNKRLKHKNYNVQLFFKIFKHFILGFIWLPWVLVAHGVSLNHTGSSVAVHGLPSCSAWSLQVWCMGSVAPQHVGSQFPNQGSNLCPHIARQILNHWITRELPKLNYSQKIYDNISNNWKVLSYYDITREVTHKKNTWT